MLEGYDVPAPKTPMENGRQLPGVTSLESRIKKTTAEVIATIVTHALQYNMFPNGSGGYAKRKFTANDNLAIVPVQQENAIKSDFFVTFGKEIPENWKTLTIAELAKQVDGIQEETPALPPHRESPALPPHRAAA